MQNPAGGQPDRAPEEIVLFHRSDVRKGISFNDFAVADTVGFDLLEDDISGPARFRLRDGRVAESTYTERPAFLSLRPFRPDPSPKPRACGGLMPLQSKRDPEFDARCAAWFARGRSNDQAVRHTHHPRACGGRSFVAVAE